jgi:excisionase family DNA binding protein
MNGRLYTVREVGDLLHVSERHIRKLISTGALRIVRIRRSVRVAPEMLELFLRENEFPRLAS